MWGVIMVAIAKDSWNGCFTEGDECEVLSIHNQYILIRENNGRLVWNYANMFIITGEFQRSTDTPLYTINWNIL